MIYFNLFVSRSSPPAGRAPSARAAPK